MARNLDPLMPDDQGEALHRHTPTSKTVIDFPDQYLKG
jgi:hypothetical protein